MKHLEQTFATYVYNHCSKCKIPIYFCNIHIKHLQHTSKTSATLEIDASIMRFQVQHLLAAYEMEACRRVEFTGGSRAVSTID